MLTKLLLQNPSLAPQNFQIHRMQIPLYSNQAFPFLAPFPFLQSRLQLNAPSEWVRCLLWEGFLSYLVTHCSQPQLPLPHSHQVQVSYVLCLCDLSTWHVLPTNSHHTSLFWPHSPHQGWFFSQELCLLFLSLPVIFSTMPKILN